MKVKCIEIVGMHRVGSAKYSMQDVNYLVGKNGAGKSTVLQAIQLALLGYIPGQKKTNAAIFRNSKGHSMSVSIELQESDGTCISISRTWTKKGQSVQSSLDISPESFDIDNIMSNLELPIFNFSELLNMSANAQKDWFISMLPDSETSTNLVSKLTERAASLNIPGEYTSDVIQPTLLHVQSMKETGIEQIRTLNTWLKDSLSAKQSELTRIDSTIQSLVYYDNFKCTMSKDECELERSKYKKLQIQMTNYLSQKSVHDVWSKRVATVKESMKVYGYPKSLQEISRLQDIISEKSIIMKDISKRETSITNLKDEVANIQSQITTIKKSYEDLRTEVLSDKHILDSNGICPYTSSKCDSLNSFFETLEAKINDSSETLKSYNSSINDLQSKINSIQEEINKLNRQNQDDKVTKLSKLETEYSTIVNQFNNYQTIIQTEPAIVDEMPSESAEEIQNKIDELDDSIIKLEANDRYNKLIKQFESQKSIVEFTIKLMKEWIKLTGPNELQTEVMTQPFLKFAENANKYLVNFFHRDDVSMKFNLSNSANSFSFGIFRDGVYIPYDLLSSGEKCLYMLAFMACIIDNIDTPLKLILLDDMVDHLDDESSDCVFDALSQMNGHIQCIIAGVKKCNNSKIHQIEI